MRNYVAWLSMKHLLAMVMIASLLASSGCVSFAANLIHAIGGNNRPAEYEGLKGKRVAVVVSTDQGLSSDTVSATLSSQIQAHLNTNIDKIDVVRSVEIEKWLDANGWNDNDYEQIGKGVEADVVLAVDVMNLTLKNGATLYRGLSDITVTVYDMEAGGKIMYRKQIPEFAYPNLGGTAITDTSEAKFRGAYLAYVARTVSGLFYEVEATEDFAIDATSSRF
ncbi:MAG: hypothetical protein R3C53_19595 [Pirellulaceae bacterium]